MTHIKLVERSTKIFCPRHVGFLGTLVTVALVLFSTGFYAAIILTSSTTYVIPETQTLVARRSYADENISESSSTSRTPSGSLPAKEDIMDFYRAQAGQDKWIFETLMGSNVDEMRNRRGFFIEFGARNGIEHANTYFFETFLGWCGMLIEANPKEQGNIAKDRPNSAVVNGAVCEKDGGTITFYDANLGGWGGAKSSYDKERLTDTESAGKEFEVPCHRLDSLVTDLRITQVDVMTVDIEGAELIALRTFPFNRIQPKLIAIEILTNTEEREEYRQEVNVFMESQGYKVCK